MNIIKKITAGTLALVLATGLACSALAEGDATVGDLTVQIDPMTNGTVTASITGYNFDPLEYSIHNQTATGTLIINASDLRGNAAGWNVTVTGTDFNNDHEFGISNLSLTGTSVNATSQTGHTTEADPKQIDVASVSNSGENTILTADKGSGAGAYEATYGASLTVPAGTLVGGYEATVTVTIKGNDPGE